jgi:hypothetical protein
MPVVLSTKMLVMSTMNVYIKMTNVKFTLQKSLSKLPMLVNKVKGLSDKLPYLLTEHYNSTWHVFC